MSEDTSLQVPPSVLEMLALFGHPRNGQFVFNAVDARLNGHLVENLSLITVVNGKPGAVINQSLGNAFDVVLSYAPDLDRHPWQELDGLCVHDAKLVVAYLTNAWRISFPRTKRARVYADLAAHGQHVSYATTVTTEAGVYGVASLTPKFCADRYDKSPDKRARSIASILSQPMYSSEQVLTQSVARP